jgi:hypothetical protein
MVNRQGQRSKKKAIKCSSDWVGFGIKCQNLGAFLENKVHKKSKLSKYVNDKS